MIPAMLHALILAGGAGTRLWPESRSRRPKQCLRIAGERTMIQATVDRLGDLVPLERIRIATTAELAGMIQEQLSQLPREAILAEPCPRNTAPCIGLAALGILRDDPEGTMIVMPADHVIEPAEAFRESVRAAAALVEREPGWLVTFGVRPAQAATGFGYIERGGPLAVAPSQPGPQRVQPAAAPATYRVAHFHEKPSRAVAQRYVAAGGHYWNAGIFLWRARTILDALARHQPDIYGHLEAISAAVDAPTFAEVLKREFAAMPKISIDYAVMEKAHQVAVVETTFAWDDVGSWMAFQRHQGLDEQGNSLDAPRHLAINAEGTILRSSSASQLVVLAGVRDLVVVVTPDAILVADKHDERSIAAVTEELKKRGWVEYL